MAHVAGSPAPHPLVTMPPHAWSTEQHPHDNSQSHRHSLPAYSSSSSIFPQQHSWNSSHQDSNIYHLHSQPPSDLPPAPDPSDPLNADTIFRDLLNLRIANDTSPDTTPSLQPHFTLQGNPHPPLLHQDLFSHSDPDSHHHEIPDQFDHLSSLPFLQHHLHQSPHDPSLSDPLSLSHRASFPSHRPFASTPPVPRPHSSHPQLFRSSTVPEQSARTSNSSRSSHPSSAPSHSGPRIKNDLYKTEICRSFAENAGFCKYGSKCQFAHGEEELRPVRRHPRYKTKLCRNFVNNGSCPYDTRCRFIHANDLPFVSAPALSALHQSSVSTALHEDNPDQHLRYEDNNLPDEEYTDHLRRILSMTPASSAPTVNASGDPSLPLSSPYASPPAELEPAHSSISTSKSLSAHIACASQSGKQSDPVVPADHVYHANANAFRNYPDNAFTQPYVPLVPVSSDAARGSSTSGDNVVTAKVGSLRDSRVVDNGDISTVFRPTGNIPVSEAFASGVKTTSLSKEKISQSTSTHDALNLSGDDELKEATIKATPTKGSRGRLPVFRNITSDGESA